MENDVLTAGVSHDGIKNKTDIKVLICYIINRCTEPMKRREIIELITENRLANYFEVCDAFAQLEESSALAIEPESGCIFLGEPAIQAAYYLSGDLPRTVLEKSAAVCDKLMQRRRNERNNSVTVEEDEDGYNVTCSVLDGKRPILSVSLHVPDQKYAELVKNRFFDNPEYIYRMNLSFLTDSKSLAPEADDDVSGQSSQ